MKIQLDENTLNAYINEAIKEELNERGIIVNRVGDNINAFLYKAIYEIAQGANIGPQVESVEEFYEQARRDRQLLGVIATGVAPIISAETGIPVAIVKPLVIVFLRNVAKDANKTFDRIGKRKEEKLLKLKDKPRS